MITRRSFSTGLTCLACCTAGQQSRAGTEPDEFICTTIDPSPLTFSIRDYSFTTGSKEPTTQSDRAEKFHLTDYGTAFYDQRWRQSDGLTPNTGLITLGVHFLEGSDVQQSAVRTQAAAWTSGVMAKLLAFAFDVPVEKSSIRIAFAFNGGNNSRVGRQNKLVPPHLKTMNLQETTKRAVLHEFGHALGLQHEHMNPNGGILWNEAAVISELKSTQGWSAETTRQNVLSRFSADAACIGDKSVNPKSIMMYQIPKRWTLNGYSTDLNTEISERDYSCLSGLYMS